MKSTINYTTEEYTDGQFKTFCIETTGPWWKKTTETSILYSGTSEDEAMAAIEKHIKERHPPEIVYKKLYNRHGSRCLDW